MKSKIIRKPENYFYFGLFIASIHFAFMELIFQDSWGNSVFATDLIKGVARIVPMMSGLERLHGYKNHWGVFYSIFWIVSPFYLILGFLSSLSLSEDGLKVLQKKSTGKMILATAISFGGCLFLYFVPDAGSKFWFNELSANSFVLLFTYFEMLGCIFVFGLFSGILRLKLSINSF